MIDCGVCVLRPWRLDDLESLVRHANNRNVWVTLRDRFPYPYTEETGRAWLTASAGQDPPAAVAIVVDGQAVGGLGIVPGSDVNRHTGEIEQLPEGDIRGISVHVAARVMAAAGSGEVFVSSSVRDLVAGSGFSFEDRGLHALKGVDEDRRLYAVVSG